jgi:futalosine hydrolase
MRDGSELTTGELLVVTAVAAEADAIRAGLRHDGVRVEVVGVGPAVAAATTTRLLVHAEARGRPYRAVVNAGIGGGVADPAPGGAPLLADRSVAADLGAETPEGFLPLDELGFGRTAFPVDAGLLAFLRNALPSAVVGAVLTVSTVTGSAGSAEALRDRYPDAVAEAMEGYGVAAAAEQAGLPFAELRTISNPIGPRDRAAWRLGDAFAALTRSAAVLG